MVTANHDVCEKTFSDISTYTQYCLSVTGSLIVANLKNTFASGKTRNLAWRKAQLAALQRLLLENRKAFEKALASDLGKPAVEVWSTEIGQTLAEISHTYKNLAGWLRPQKVRSPLALQPAQSKVYYDPLGTVLIIAPWNYPLQLLFSPLVGALAGGNCVILKPSELASHTADVVARLVPQYLDSSAVQVVTGDAQTVTALIAAKPDKVFFTGSTRVGKIIAAECAEKLIPVELELGGKSPVYVHHDADLKVAAKRLVWAKFLNAGQTCTAPDYVYVHEKVAKKFSRLLVKAVKNAYPNPRSSKSYGRIITVKHATRLASMQQPDADARLLHGGEADPQNRFVAPTILFGVSQQHPAMREEIFGPILPVLPITSWRAAAAAINEREKPLAAYIFTSSKRLAAKFREAIFSGGFAINAAVLHSATPYLPFGGVGESGQGSYHGKWSFKAFTQERGVLYKPTAFDTLKLVYPPVRKPAVWVLRLLLHRRRLPRKSRRLAQLLQQQNLDPGA